MIPVGQELARLNFYRMVTVQLLERIKSPMGPVVFQRTQWLLL